MTSLFESAALSTVAPIDARPRKKYGWLPLLTVLFLISYGLMTMLIVEQGATIESQRALIRELFRDSSELSGLRMKAQQDKSRAQSPTAKTQAPVTQKPSFQVPSTQAPTNQAPASRAVPQHRTQNQSEKQKPQFQVPSRPASDLVDDRRALITI